MDKSDLSNQLLSFPVLDIHQFELKEAGKRVGGNKPFQHNQRIINYWALLIIERGTLALYEENTKLLLGPGESYLLAPGLKHGGFEQHSCDFYWFHFTCAHVQKQNSEQIVLDAEFTGKTTQTVSIPKYHSIQNSSAVFKYLNAYLEKYSTQNLYQDARLRCAFQTILFSLIDDYLSNQQVNQLKKHSSSHHVFQLSKYLKKYYSDPQALNKAINNTGLNKDYANRLFKKHTHMSLQEFCIQQRIEAAKKLLENEQLSVQEIAETVGYEDPYYFSRIFKQKCGLSPSYYRETIYRVRNR